MTQSTQYTLHYRNRFGEGGFMYSAATDWIAARIPGAYDVRLKNGSVHRLEADEFAQFRRAWEGVDHKPENAVNAPAPMPTFARPTCRGSLQLGSACGYCERCDWERAQRGL